MKSTNSQFNGDFTLDMTSHRVLGIGDLNNPKDPGPKSSPPALGIPEGIGRAQGYARPFQIEWKDTHYFSRLVGGFPGKSGGLWMRSQALMRFCFFDKTELTNWSMATAFIPIQA